MTGKNIRAAGKAAIINEKEEILAIKRAGDETHLENLWDVPGGRFDHGETPQEGLKREVREESGLQIRIVEPVKSWSFTRENGEQVFGTTFLCEPEEGLEVDLGDEHTDFRWVNVSELEGLEMHDELREGLKLAHEKWREGRELPKLVRDMIPEIIRENGDEAEIKKVEGQELEKFMRKKILEEAEEFSEDGEPEELADLLEVIDSYIEKEGLERTELEELREEKRSERGGFSEGFVLEHLD